MDFSANLHHQLLQLESQLLLGSGSGHAWTPDITLSPSCNLEANFHFQDSNPAIVDTEERFTSLQHYSHGSCKDKKFEEVKGKASAPFPKSNENLRSHCFEDLNKIAQSCCCSNIDPLSVEVSSRKPLMAELSSSLGFDHSFFLASSHHFLQLSRTSSLLTEMPNHEITQPKRPCTLKQQTATQTPSKKSRVEPRVTCPPLKDPTSKRVETSLQFIREVDYSSHYQLVLRWMSTLSNMVSESISPNGYFGPIRMKLGSDSRLIAQKEIRKDKLGDRIAALQQLVAPFGKTDTASVLMEAISYINFLQNQVEMLSHSYMKSCRTKNYRTIFPDGLNEKDTKPESDLKGKGLCLVPLAYTSYLPEDTSTAGRIGSIWSPLAAASFNRRTY